MREPTASRSRDLPEFQTLFDRLIRMVAAVLLQALRFALSFGDGECMYFLKVPFTGRKGPRLGQIAAVCSAQSKRLVIL